MEQNVSRMCHKICLPNNTSEVRPCAPRGPAAGARSLPTGVTRGEPGDTARHGCFQYRVDGLPFSAVLALPRLPRNYRFAPPQSP